MKPMDMLMKIASIVTATVLIFIFLKLEESGGKVSNFYEYDNSKINLLQVKKILPRIDYIITYKEDEYVELFRKHSLVLNEYNIEKVSRLLKEVKSSEYYSVELLAYMMFDDEKIELFHSSRYLKKVANYRVNDYLLKVLKRHGIDDFQYANIAKLKEKVYKDKEKFLEDVTSIGKLKKAGWCEENIPILGLSESGIRFMNNIDTQDKEKFLRDEDLEQIEEKLRKAYVKYEAIR